MLLSKGMPSLQVRCSQLILTMAIAGLLFYIYTTRPHGQGQTFKFGIEDTTPWGDLLPEEEYLERLIDHYGLANFTKWQAWRVRSSEQSLDMSPITDMDADFQPHLDTPKIIDLEDPSPSDLRATKRMELPTHRNAVHGQQHASKFLFGISTTYERMAYNNWAIMRAWKRWLTRSDGTTSGASLVLMLDNATQDELDKIDNALRKAGIEVYTTSTVERASKARRYYELIRIMKTYSATLAASGQEKDWYGVVEDTVFFPSLPYLHERLSAYDSSEQLYIGIPSEKMDWQHDGKSITTLGGGAVFLTRQTVNLIPKLPCIEGYASSPGSPFRAQKWDAVLKQCVKQWAGIDMHVIPAFYSPKDADYKPHLECHETGVRPLLLHDYQVRHRLDVSMAHLVTDICGEACFMHRYMFHDNWVVINGMSISYYPSGLGPGPDQDQERGDEAGKRDVSMGGEQKSISGQIVINEEGVEKRPLEWTGQRDVWELLDSAKAANGAIWQAYLKRGRRRPTGSSKEDAAGEVEELDSVIVLIWESKQQS